MCNDSCKSCSRTVKMSHLLLCYILTSDWGGGGSLSGWLACRGLTWLPLVGSDWSFPLLWPIGKFSGQEGEELMGSEGGRMSPQGLLIPCLLVYIIFLYPAIFDSSNSAKYWVPLGNIFELEHKQNILFCWLLLTGSLCASCAFQWPLGTDYFHRCLKQ
jgi:hypothetical protein